MIETKTIDIIIYPDGRMDPINAALYLGLGTGTLAQKRSDGTGPVFIKRGRVFYYKTDLDNWLLQDGLLTKTNRS